MNTQKSKRIAILVIVLCSVTLLLKCKKEIEITSIWPEPKILVDGKGGEWRGKLLYLTGNINVGVANDSNYLYVNISTTDKRIQMQVLRIGLHLSFTPQGNKESVLGITFPLMQEHDDFLNIRRDRHTPGEMPKELLEPVNRALKIDTFNIEKPLLVRTAQTERIGIQAQVGIEEKYLTYELKVPLHKADNTPFSVNVGNNETIDIHIETPEVTMDKMHGKRPPRMGGGGSGMGPGGMGPGGIGGGSGMGPGGMGPGTRPGGMSPPEKISLHLRVTLTSARGINDAK